MTSSEWKVVDTSRDVSKAVNSRQEAEDTREDMISLGADPEAIEVVSPDGEERANIAPDGAVVQQGGKPDSDTSTNGGTEVVEQGTIEPKTETQNTAKDVIEARKEMQANDLPDSQPNIDQDPVDWLPSHFVDTIQGVPTVNRKGYAVIASRFNVSVTAKPVVRASETDFEYAEFRAVATTEDGEEYSGFGSAHIDRQDGDDPYLLNELAETRAMKRAIAWASGVGLTAAEELRNEP